MDLVDLMVAMSVGSQSKAYKEASILFKATLEPPSSRGWLEPAGRDAWFYSISWIESALYFSINQNVRNDIERLMLKENHSTTTSDMLETMLKKVLEIGDMKLFERVLSFHPTPDVALYKILSPDTYKALSGHLNPEEILAVAVRAFPWFTIIKYFTKGELEVQDFVEREMNLERMAVPRKVHTSNRGLRILLKDKIDPTSPPQYIRDVFRDNKVNLDRKISSKQAEANAHSRRYFISMLIDFGADTDLASLQAIARTLSSVDMAPVVARLASDGVKLPPSVSQSHEKTLQEGREPERWERSFY